MIKYLGSKRALVPVLGAIADAVGARSAVDLFTGTTRVAQEFKRRGLHTTAVDLATYAAVFADCYVATDADHIDDDALKEALAELNDLPGRPGYVTETFCHSARYFHPRNGARIDAIRDRLDDWRDTPLYPVLLTALLLAADKVDSTTGVQMAFLKQWAPRALRDLRLRRPALLPGTGVGIHGDALQIVADLPPVDLMYLDPPYNQHRYFTNYHVWETLVRWDEPDHYGIACKRTDARDDETRSPFNSKRTMPDAFEKVIADARAEVVLVSYNDEGWVTPEQVCGWLRAGGHEAVDVLGFDSRRYIGAQIGIYSRDGRKVGTAGRLRNVEYVMVAGPSDKVRRAREAAAPWLADSAKESIPA